MKKTNFGEFLNANQIKIDDLPKPIQDKIGIYEDLAGQFDDTIDEDKKALEGMLQDLEDEIYEDLLNEFEDQLSNNKMKEKPRASASRKKQTEKQSQKQHKDEEQDQEEDQDNTDQQINELEKILERLFESGKTDDLSRTYLRSKGLDMDFSEWEIPVGKYVLLRQSVFHIHFRLAKIESE